MNLRRYFSLGGLAVSCCCAPLCADERSYMEGARAHPFMLLGGSADTVSAIAAGVSLDGFALVGTLAQGDSFQALVRDQRGVVRRLHPGDGLVDQQAVLVEVTEATARFEWRGNSFILAFEESEEMAE